MFRVVLPIGRYDIRADRARGLGERTFGRLTGPFSYEIPTNLFETSCAPAEPSRPKGAVRRQVF